MRNATEDSGLGTLAQSTASSIRSSTERDLVRRFIVVIGIGADIMALRSV
ncbi:hypothetical protein WME79_15305 [Sorangium sp. So ce726]